MSDEQAPYGTYEVKRVDGAWRANRVTGDATGGRIINGDEARRLASKHEDDRAERVRAAKTWLDAMEQLIRAVIRDYEDDSYYGLSEVKDELAAKIADGEL